MVNDLVPDAGRYLSPLLRAALPPSGTPYLNTGLLLLLVFLQSQDFV